MSERQAQVDVNEVMKEIRDRVRKKQVMQSQLDSSSVWQDNRLSSIELCRLKTAKLRHLMDRWGELPPSPPTLRARVGTFLLKLVNRALFWEHAQMRRFHEAVAGAVEEQMALIEALTQRVQSQLSFTTDQLSQVKALEGQLSALSEEIANVVRPSLDAFRSELSRLYQRPSHDKFDELSERISATENSCRNLEQQVAGVAVNLGVDERYIRDTRRDLILQEHRLSMVLAEIRKKIAEAPTEDAQTPVAMTRLEEGSSSHESLYLALEDAFRGTPGEIGERLGIYPPLLAKAGMKAGVDSILDLGCGRGEWLLLLKKEGFRAAGCDTNEMMVEECLAMGLDVTSAGLIDFLNSQPAASASAVTAFHVVEHLPLETMIRALGAALRVLRPGGLIILETPNPQNMLVGTHNFYLDPTHRNPLPAPLLRFLLEERGFCMVELLNLHPYPESFLIMENTETAKRFNEYFYGAQDYAVIGHKS